MFDVDSFGSRCPKNWEEILDYLNEKVEDGMDNNDIEKIWETYCSGGYGDAPEAIMEEDSKMEENRREIEMAFDHECDGELCHTTGYEVLLDGEWWVEYEDSEGNLHYGR